MSNVDALGYDAETSDPLYKLWPFYITFVPNLDIACGFFYDNLAEIVFDMGKEVDAVRGGSYRTYRAESGGARLPATEFVLPPHETRPVQVRGGENRWQDEHGWHHITGL